MKYLLIALVSVLVNCSSSLVMKPKDFTRPVMVGEIRQIGGQKQPPEAGRGYEFSGEIESLDTPTSSALDADPKREKMLDHKLIATSLGGERDALIAEIKFGSYVFFPVLLYFDKDWIRVSGYGEGRVYKEPQRVYNLNPVIRVSRKDKKEEKRRKEKEKKQREKEKRDARKKRRR